MDPWKPFMFPVKERREKKKKKKPGGAQKLMMAVTYPWRGVWQHLVQVLVASLVIRCRYFIGYSTGPSGPEA